jgi:hypothetical protein
MILSVFAIVVFGMLVRLWSLDMHQERKEYITNKSYGK